MPLVMQMSVDGRRNIKYSNELSESSSNYCDYAWVLAKEALIDGFQDYMDTTKSDGSFKQTFRPDVLVANTNVIKFGHNLTRGNKMVIMEPNFSVQMEAQECKREHRLEILIESEVFFILTIVSISTPGSTISARGTLPPVLMTAPTVLYGI